MEKDLKKWRMKKKSKTMEKMMEKWLKTMMEKRTNRSLNGEQ